MKNLQILLNQNLHFNENFCFRVTCFEKHLPIIYEFMRFYFEREKQREADRQKDRNGEGGREEGREGGREERRGKEEARRGQKRVKRERENMFLLLAIQYISLCKALQQ